MYWFGENEVGVIFTLSLSVEIFTEMSAVMYTEPLLITPEQFLAKASAESWNIWYDNEMK